MDKNQCDYGYVRAYICKCNGIAEVCSHGVKSGHIYGGLQSCQHFSLDGQCHNIKARGIRTTNASQNMSTCFGCAADVVRNNFSLLKEVL